MTFHFQQRSIKEVVLYQDSTELSAHDGAIAKYLKMPVPTVCKKSEESTIRQPERGEEELRKKREATGSAKNLLPTF